MQTLSYFLDEMCRPQFTVPRVAYTGSSVSSPMTAAPAPREGFWISIQAPVHSVSFTYSEVCISLWFQHC